MKIKSWICLTMTLIVGIAFAEDGDIVQVKGTGTGVTETEALKDACRDAVETAVGLYVDAEQMVKNDELIKDEILTQSNAYIEGYKELSRTSENGVVTIKIVASVRTRTLAKRIGGVMPAKSVTVGSQLANIHAQSVTQETRGKDAVAIFKKELQELRKLRNLYEIELASPEGRPVKRMERRACRNGKWVDLNADDDNVEMDYLLRMTINSKRYFEEVVPRLDGVLSQISIEEPKLVRYSVRNDSSCDAKLAEMYLTSGTPERGYGQGFHKFSLWRLGKSNFAPNPEAAVGPCGRPVDPLRVSLIVFANEAMTVVRGKQYLLGDECKKAYLEWADVKNGDYPMRMQLPNALVSFLGPDEEPIAESEVDMVWGNNAGSCVCERFESGSWKITPWIGGNAKSYYRWFRFKLPKADLPKIKTIKVEVVN